MAKSKEEIEYSIRELQAQYEALIAEGSYKLADQRLKRIKELTQQLKTMKDTHEILTLCGYATDAMGGPGYKIKFGRDPQGNEEVEVRLESGKTKKFRGTEAVKEAYVWINTNKDACEKVFTKGTDDDSPKEELIKYAEKTKDPEYIAHVKGLKNPNTINARLQAHRQGKDGDIILPQHKCSDDDATNKLEPEKMIGHKEGGVEDGGPGSGIKGHSTAEKLEKRQDYLESQIRKLKTRGDRYSRQMLKGFMEEYDAITRRLSNIKDSDPLAAEAQAIINLCGGAM